MKKTLFIASLFVASILIASLALLPNIPAAPSYAQPSGVLQSTPPNPIAEQFVPNHVSLRVTDLEKSVRWYQDVMGAHVLRRSRVPDIDPDIEIAFMQLSHGFHIELVGGGKLSRPEGLPPKGIAEDYRLEGYKHIGFSVTDYDRTLTYLRSKNVSVLREGTRRDYGVHIALFKDPNGYLIELYGPLPAEQNVGQIATPTNTQSNATQPRTGPLYMATPPWAKPPGQDEPRNWFPSRYGPNDEIGAANLLTPSVVRRATGLVTQGKTYALGLEVNSKTPGYPPRHIDHYLLENIGSDHSNLDDIVTGWLNVGTQIDGLAHMGIGGVFYNGNKSADIVDANGLKKLGIEKVPPLVTRGVLLDMARYKGVQALQGGQAFTVADIEGACRQQGVQIERGDVVLLHTGWMDTMSGDTLRYYDSQPGPGRAVAEYLATKGIVALGSDTPRVDVVPFETPQEFFPVHQTLITKNGIYLLESVNTSALARDGVHEFLFVLGQPRFTGASQTIVNPVAIR